MRVRRNADPKLRGLERAVAAGDAGAIPGLIVQRLRDKTISPRLAKAARFFSAPLSPPGSTSHPYNWHPLNWSYNELTAPASEFEQDPRTLILHSALVEVLGPRMKLPIKASWPVGTVGVEVGNAISAAAESWMSRLGFFVSDTGGVGNHAPFEIQSDDAPDRDTEEEWRRVLAAQGRVATAYEDATGSPGQVSDTAYMWLVKRDLFLGRANAISVMKWLRVNSTVEYCNVLGANVYQQKDRHDPPFGLTEYRLVSTWLGGGPL
jgi:hypothetical protein